jgi:hypothetical protein
MTMANIVKGKILKPQRVLVYGVEKVGKTSFAAQAPEPIFLGSEDGTNELNIHRLPQPHSWNEALEGIDFLTRAEHPYKTLVVDTLDWLEPLCWKHLLTTKKGADGKWVTDIEGYGFAKGYIYAIDSWRIYLRMLERLRDARGMWIVQLAHSHVKTFKNPAGEDYDRYTLKMHEKAGGLMKEWSDIVLFAQHETYTHEKNKRVKGLSTGARVLHTVRTAAWDAGSRVSLPETIPLDWHEFYREVQDQRPADPEQMKARIAELLGSLEDERVHQRVQADVNAAGDDAAVLARIVNKLTATVGLQNQDQEETATP